jgi:ubiquinone/menaquinone biosynthesis C-methylase UbiE
MPHVFDPKEIAKLDNPERYLRVNPDAIVSGSGLHTGDKVADIGIGTGFFALAALRLVGPSGFLFGLDISDEMIGAAARKLAGHENVSLIKTDGRTLPLPDGAIDVALMGFVLHEASDKAGILDEVRRILVPGGRVVIIDWDVKKTDKGPPLSDRMAPHQTETALHDCGFTVERIDAPSDYDYCVIATKPARLSRD